MQQSSSQGKTMVFTSTVASAEEAAQVLEQADLSPLVYHRDIPQTEREDIVQQAASRYSTISLVLIFWEC